ncbi:MAG TPA: GNAT family N-acetyltransferase [Gallionellaceae bacterium]|nr:GNAT family N-acetyltransferase [Gallionellaceae bacterium]
MSTLFAQPAVPLEACALSAPPTPQQAQAVAEMLAASEPWATLKFPAAALAHYLTRDDPALRRYVISVEGEVAGIICVRHPWLRGPYIELLGLSPHLRGKGIGRQVMNWAESEARQGAKNLWVVASAFNHRALAFYGSLGFHPIATLPDLVSPGQDEILLRKPLA